TASAPEASGCTFAGADVLGLSCRRPSLLKALPRFENRLHAAEDEHPAAGDVLGGLRCAFELVVGDRQLRETSLMRLDLPGHAARCFNSELGIVERAPRD